MRARSASPKVSVPRRSFLRGAGGALLALPLLDAFTTGPAGAGVFPKRLVIMFSGNGTLADAWTPTGGETDFVLGDILAPLAPHREDLLILAGIDATSSYHGPGDGAHYNAMGHLLTGTELIDLGDYNYTGGGISIDQRIAQAIGATTKLPTLELSVEQNPATVLSHMSYLGPNQPMPPEPDPTAVFQRLFDGATPDQKAQRVSVLDAVKGDFATLAPRLGTADRLKVEQHLEAVRAVEKSLLATTAVACDPVAVGRDDLRDVPAVGKDQMDMLVQALSCDLTRVVTLQWSQAESMTRMTWLGIPDAHHDLSHMTNSDPVVHGKLSAINQWYATELAYLLAAMKAVPEGDGTLLDHSLVVWCNELSDGEVHSRHQIPYVLAGQCCGAVKTGRFLQYGALVGEPPPPHNDLLVAIAQAMGVDLDTFGNPAYCSGMLRGLTG
jgi:Protein of unknown function (DUF1552)